MRVHVSCVFYANPNVRPQSGFGWIRRLVSVYKFPGLWNCPGPASRRISPTHDIPRKQFCASEQTAHSPHIIPIPTHFIVEILEDKHFIMKGFRLEDCFVFKVSLGYLAKSARGQCHWLGIATRRCLAVFLGCSPQADNPTA